MSVRQHGGWSVRGLTENIVCRTRDVARCARAWTALLLLLPAADAAGQSPLHDLFDRIQEQTSAPAEQNGESSGPFADDPAPGTAPRIHPVQQPIRPSRGEALPPPRIEGLLPLAGGDTAGDVQLTPNANGRISLVVRDASLSKVLSLLAQTQQLNIVASNDIDALISITLRDVPLEEALTAILSVANYTWVQQNNIILVTSLTDAGNLPPDVQGRQIQVFDLDFASAESVAESVTNFLSPIGKVTVSASETTNSRRTRELVIVEDLPESLARIGAYIDQIDCPPRQVLIEAHVLQVKLEDETRNGVDFHALFRLAGAHANILSVPTLASALPTGDELPITPSAPAFLATIAGSDFQAVVELLQRTNDSKTLGSPKLLVLNEQQARLQVGEQKGYSTSTTTETSTVEQVQFLNTGVILTIIPRITRDGRVLLHVKPEVSDGDVVGNLPSSSTTTLETDVMLSDGQGMIIGGLIKEVDTTGQQKVPYFGDLRWAGWLFRKTEVTKERTEVIFALLPRIQPYSQQYQEYEQGELVRAGVPLYEGPLCRTDRPWDPILPDGKRVYRPLAPWRSGGYWPSQYGSNAEYMVPPYPLPQQRIMVPPCEPGPAAQVAPFLSDEALPAPPGVEVISDQ